MLIDSAEREAMAAMRAVELARSRSDEHQRRSQRRTERASSRESEPHPRAKPPSVAHAPTRKSRKEFDPRPGRWDRYDWLVVLSLVSSPLLVAGPTLGHLAVYGVNAALIFWGATSAAG